MARAESTLQRACVAWFRIQYRSRADMLFAVPNGGGRSRVEAAIMKGEGVTPGVADLILLEPRGGFASLCIEMKKDAKARQSEVQKAWQDAAEAFGNKYVVCRSFEQFQEIVRDYMSMPSIIGKLKGGLEDGVDFYPELAAMTKVYDIFISLVRELRKAQEDYKRSRRYDDHARADELEREVDAWIRDHGRKDEWEDE